MEWSDIRRLTSQEQESARLKKLLVQTMLDKGGDRGRFEKAVLISHAKRTAIAEVQAETAISARHACKLVGLTRSTLRYEPGHSLEDERLKVTILIAHKPTSFG